MTADPAVRARDRSGVLPPVITVVTDLITAHLSWRDALVDRVVVPSEEMAVLCAKDDTEPGRYVPLGLPVAAEFGQPALGEAERKELKRELGVQGEFLVVLTGGAEGSGGLRRRAAAILRQVDDVDVAVICGRNRLLKRQVSRLAVRSGDGRLSAHGFVGNMPDWLRCADLVVGKAGPGTIAEATCCGAPLVLTSYVPGQEQGNAEFVTGAGAGVFALAAQAARRGDRPAAPRSWRARRDARGVGASGPPPCGHRHRPLPGRAVRRAPRLWPRPADHPDRGLSGGSQSSTDSPSAATSTGSGPVANRRPMASSCSSVRDGL